MPPSEDAELNRFFPEQGGFLFKSLGLLDLIFGAPTRAVQGGIISGMRGEDIASGAWKSFIGQSLDTGEFGKGEIASGLELLEELGVVHDKDHLGNIFAGAGIDIVSDLAMFNFLSAGRRLAGKGTTELMRMSARGARYRSFRADKYVSDMRQARHIKQIMLLNLGEEAQDDFIKQIRLHYPESKLSKSDLETVRKLVFTDFKSFDANKKLNWMAGQFDVDRLDLRYVGRPSDLQHPFINPSIVEMGHAVGEIPEKATADFFETIDLHAFRVVDKFKLSQAHAGSNRQATWYDLKFPNAPRFLRDIIPANQPGLFPHGIELTVTPPSIASRAYHRFTKWFAHVSPFDFQNVLERVGMAPLMVRGYRAFTKAQLDDFEKVEKIAGKIGLQKGTAQAERLGEAADGNLGALARTSAEELDFIGKRKELFDQKWIEAMEETGDPRLRKFYEEGGLNNPNYLHHKRLDLQEKIGPAFRIESPDGASFGLADDFYSNVKVPQFLRRVDEKAKVSYDIVQEMRMYITAINRKIHLEPVIKQLLPDLNRLNQRGTASLFWAGQDFIQLFLGNYGRFDAWFDSLASVVGLNTRNLATKLSLVAHGATVGRWERGEDEKRRLP